MIRLTVVVNTNPVTVDVTDPKATRVADTIKVALRSAGHADDRRNGYARQWELRDHRGFILDRECTLAANHVHDGARLFLTLHPGASA